MYEVSESNPRIIRQNGLDIIEAPQRIEKLLELNDSLIALLEGEAIPDDRNVCCYKKNGTIVWTISPPIAIHSRNYFTGIYLREGTLFAYSISGVEYELDSATGTFVNSELIK